MLADKLGIPFYNREIITMASEDSGVNAMLFSDERLKGDFLTRLRAHYHGNAPVPNDSSKSYLKDEALFAYQVKIIRRLADQGPCVMIGRCADYILREDPDCIDVFISAGWKDRICRAMEYNHLEEKEAQEFLRKADKSRASYYNYYTDIIWGAAESYDLCINSSLYGIDRTVAFIRSFIDW